MTTNNDDTRKTANCGDSAIIKTTQTNNDDKVYIGELKKPVHFDIMIQFNDGETAVFKNAKSMQEFFDKVNAFHKLEKENQQLKELLKECYQEISEYLDNDSRLMCILGEMFKNGR